MTHETLRRICTPEEFLAMSEVDRLLTVRRQIELDPDTWYQENWIRLDVDVSDEAFYRYREEIDKPTKERNLCGTGFCLGGWTAVLAGDRFVGEESVAYTWDGVVLVADVVDRADRLLGFVGGPRYDIYSSDNDLDDLDGAIHEILADRGYRYDKNTITAEPYDAEVEA